MVVIFSEPCTSKLHEPDYFSRVTDESGGHFGYSIDSYYNKRSKISANIVGGKGICWMGIGTDALGHNVAGKTISLSLQKYVDPNDVLSVSVNHNVALITSKDVVYMIQYQQKLDNTIQFSFYRYWQYKNLALLRQYALGNNTVVNVGKYKCSRFNGTSN